MRKALLLPLAACAALAGCAAYVPVGYPGYGAAYPAYPAYGYPGAYYGAPVYGDIGIGVFGSYPAYRGGDRRWDGDRDGRRHWDGDRRGDGDRDHDRQWNGGRH